MIKKTVSFFLFVACYLFCGWALYKVKKDVYPKVKVRKHPKHPNQVETFYRSSHLLQGL